MLRRWIELSLIAGGAAALVYSAVTVLAREHGSARLVEEFAVAKLQPPARSAEHPRDVSPPLRLAAAPADQSDWSDKRRREYASIAHDRDAAIAVLRIPDLDLEVPVLAGADEAQLAQGAGWLDRTAFPGEPGNAALAAHRDSFFRRLGELQTGSMVSVDTSAGRFEYEIVGLRIVDPDDVSVLLPAGDESLMTLITCYPFRYVGRAPQRYVAIARLRR